MNRSERVQLGETSLTYAEYGLPEGNPVFYFHGWPGSRFEAAHAERAARELSLRIIAPDRPGMGGSDYAPARRLLDWPDTIEKLADHLGLGKFSVLGLSGGGPYALACALRLEDRVDRVGICAGVPHYNWLRTDRGARALFRYGIAIDDIIPGAAVLPLLLAWGLLKLVGPFDFLRLLRFYLGEHERRTLKDRHVRAIIAQSVRESFRGPVKGLYHDLRLLTSPWGFSVSDIRLPVQWWHGVGDHVCPVKAVRTATANASSIHVEEFADEGHFSVLFNRTAPILEYFAAGRR